jgi:hypothetical protein
VEAVADAANIEDEPLRVPGDRTPAEASDHRAPPAT